MTLFSSLTNRIFLASALLSVLSIGTAVYIVNVRVTREAERELQRGLEEAGRLVDQHRATLLENFIRMARLIADLPKLKAAVDLGDPPTVQPLAEDYRAQVASDLLMITHRSGRVLALAVIGDLGSAAGTSAAQGAIKRALAGRETTAFWPMARGILQVVTVPIVIGPDSPEILGTLSVGFVLDDQLAERFKALTESDVVFAVGGHIQAGTLPRAYFPRLEALLQKGGTSRMWLGGTDYVALARTLAPSGSGLVSEEAPVPTALILRSRTERLNFLGPLHTALAATAFVALALATLLSYGVARTVTRPLRALTSTMREMAVTGDLNRREAASPSRGWEDEDARVLAATFGSMTDALARFQREAGRRERLASLGRLSTVIAHEIRNPLMIIKTAVRTLRQGGTPDEWKEALGDIDGEIARLNRLVNDVLDFARPIRFEYAPADINAICRASAGAAMAGDPEVEPRLSLDPALPVVVTDGDRLHSVLVNVLTNARDALKARRVDERKLHPSRNGDPLLEVVTELRPGGRIAILIRDRGTGIQPEDLPRVADPYFTTKRGGTGLGLAIAKNILDGLGGTLTVESQAGEGTLVRLELPAAPPHPWASASGERRRA
jgi:signal transduction histidine kinase